MKFFIKNFFSKCEQICSFLRIWLHLLRKPLNSDSHLIKKFCFNESSFKMMKNAFYFILKTLVVIKISKFLSYVFGNVENMT